MEVNKESQLHKRSLSSADVDSETFKVFVYNTLTNIVDEDAFIDEVNVELMTFTSNICKY